MISPLEPRNQTTVIEKINAVLAEYSDKDWNYSRITLEIRELESIDGPYALSVFLINVKTKEGRKEFGTYESEVTWGDRHSNELGILEMISLRINKALMETSSDEHWDFVRPVVRLTKREELLEQGITTGIWYRVAEVAGEEFDAR